MKIDILSKRRRVAHTHACIALIATATAIHTLKAADKRGHTHKDHRNRVVVCAYVRVLDYAKMTHVTFISTGNRFSYHFESSLDAIRREEEDEDQEGRRCPSCLVPFEASGRKRRLVDVACGHGRCYDCTFGLETCPICAVELASSSSYSPVSSSTRIVAATGRESGLASSVASVDNVSLNSDGNASSYISLMSSGLGRRNSPSSESPDDLTRIMMMRRDSRCRRSLCSVRSSFSRDCSSRSSRGGGRRHFSSGMDSIEEVQSEWNTRRLFLFAQSGRAGKKGEWERTKRDTSAGIYLLPHPFFFSPSLSFRSGVSGCGLTPYAPEHCSVSTLPKCRGRRWRRNRQWRAGK